MNPELHRIQELQQMASNFPNTEPLPVLFLGHGSPMNAIEENSFVQGFRKIAKTLPTPSAILCISAHWETRGTFVTAMEKPPTIHDFGGFPDALYQVQYPAPGSPSLAEETQKIIRETNVSLDYSWGLDHGAWSVIKHLFPKADIPVVQMSLDHSQGPRFHYDLGKALLPLRRKGILIIGSGNMVHNLRLVDWKSLNQPGFAYDWAAEASEKMKAFLLDRNVGPLIDYHGQGKAFDLAIPTPEHYLPLLYAIALQENSDELSLFNDEPVAGALTMTSLRIGRKEQ